MTEPKRWFSWEIADEVQRFKLTSSVQFVEASAYDALKAENERLRAAVVQLNHGDGYYSHHSAILQNDHPGFDGYVIHIGSQVNEDSAKPLGLDNKE
jgi:hypothetical protein